MTKGGYLPNIAEKFGRWETEAIKSLGERNYEQASACLHFLNALLTEEYLVTIDDDQYAKQMNELVVWECRYCKKEAQGKDIKVFDRLLSDMDANALGHTTEKSWRCVDCLKSQPVSGVGVVLTRVKNPFYPKFMYAEPRLGLGLEMKYSYPPAFRKWFYRFLEILQHQLAIYRIEYKSINGQDMTEPEYQDKGTENVS